MSNYEDALEEFDDPETADLEADQKGQEDAEIDSDEVFGTSDEEGARRYALKFKVKAKEKAQPGMNKHAKRPTAADFMGSEREDEDDEIDGEIDSDDDDDDDDEDEDDLSNGSEANGFIDDEAEESDDGKSGFSDEEEDLWDDDDDEDEDEDEDEERGEYDEEERTGSAKKSNLPNESAIAASVKQMMGEQSVVKSLLKTVDADVQKGKAVQRQRKGFDALLNLRIRLQKSASQTC